MDESKKRHVVLKVDEVQCVHPFNGIILDQVFPYLDTKSLVSASRVCVAWNRYATDKLLWKTVRLKNVTVRDWNLFVTNVINKYDAASLDLHCVRLPPDTAECESFWLDFALSLKIVANLKRLCLYHCPPHVVECATFALSQLEVFEATSIRMQDENNAHHLQCVPLSLTFLVQWTNLTVLRLKSLSKIQFKMLPTFKNLIHLETLSLTSNKPIDHVILNCLATVSTGLKRLEFGDCTHLADDFAVLLKRFVNLTSLRLEHFHGISIQVTRNVFASVRSLKKLTTLELINIIISTCVKNELEKCTGIGTLLIIPHYGLRTFHVVNCLVQCLGKLSGTLNRVVWGLTIEYLNHLDTIIFQTRQSNNIFDWDGTNYTNRLNHVLIRTPIVVDDVIVEYGMPLIDFKYNIITIQILELVLEKKMPHTDISLFKDYFSTDYRLQPP